MKRFLILALVGAWSLAGGTGLAFGQTGHPQTPTKPQATKPSPPPSPKKDTRTQPPKKDTRTAPPKKDTRSKPPTQANKPPSHRDVKIDVPKGGSKPPAKKGPDWGKVGMGVMEGVFGTAAGISAVAGATEAVTTSPTVVGAIPGAVLAGVEGAAAVKEFADAGRDITEGLDLDDAQKSNKPKDSRKIQGTKKQAPQKAPQSRKKP